MSHTLNDAAAAPAALSAFLRGVERRGALFGELQCGDREAGDAALAAAMRAFRNHAAALPMAEWPRRFWALLAATPQLRQDAPAARWTPGLDVLAPLDPGLRQALLLRLAAGLAEDEASAALGIDQDGYRQALARACPRDAGGEPDAQAWRALAEAIQQELRDLPPQRLARLAHLREVAIDGARPPRTPSVATPAATPAFAHAPRRRRWPWLLLGIVAACAAALLLAWGWSHWRASPGPGAGVAADEGRVQETPVITSEPLPGSEVAARYDARDALPTHPDFALLLDAEDEAIAYQADFLAWHLAGQQAVPETLAESTDAVLPATEAETSDAQF